MVNLIPPTHTTPAAKSSHKKDQPTPANSIGDQPKYKPSPEYQKPFKDRRKGSDRRIQQGRKRSVYDMRSSRGRRKTDRGGAPNIETKA